MTTSRMKMNDIRFVFFGSAPLGDAAVLALANVGLVPQRTISSTKIEPGLIDELAQADWDVFVVASYGKILPKRLLDIPKRGTINVHPSLLPRLRGPSPIRTAILNDDKETGVSIMLLDEKMDHGPLLAQKKVPLASWPPHGKELDEILAHEGGKLLAHILPLWISGDIEARPQNDDLATYCSFIKKEDGLLDLSANPYENLLKIRAYEEWPVAYTFFERAGKKLRVQILDAHLEAGKLAIDFVKPEGKGEMSYQDFLRSGAKPTA